MKRCWDLKPRLLDGNIKDATARNGRSGRAATALPDIVWRVSGNGFKLIKAIESVVF